MSKKTSDYMYSTAASDARTLINSNVILIRFYGEMFKQLTSRHIVPQNDLEGRTHHVHIVESGDNTIEQRILFRDILRRDKKVRLDYEALKLKLSQSHSSDREAYTDSKLEFIETVLKKYYGTQIP